MTTQQEEEFEVTMPTQPAKPKVTDPPKEPATKVPAPEEDEEDMFTESVQVQGEVKLMDSTPAITAKHDLSDTIFVFKDDEILINCLKKSSGWFVGDVLNSMRVPEFCSIAKVTPDEHKTTSFDGMLTGGHMYGYP